MSDPAALVPYGWDPDRAVPDLGHVSLEDGVTAQRRVGRVITVDRLTCTAITADGPVRARAEALPVVGDWAIVTAPPGGLGDVIEVLERHGELARVGAGAEERGPERHVLAANVDVVFVVHPLDRPVNPNRLDREVVVALDAGARPIVALSKADLHPDAAGVVDDLAARLLDVAVVITSARTGQGIDMLAAALQPHLTGVLIGPSGAGKSSIANRLLGGDVQATADVRGADRRGRHTTSARQLFLVPSGGVLIDTPGLRSVGLWDAAEGLGQAFADVASVAARCRFRDCTHAHEPGCAVIAAVEAGTLDAARVESFCTLQAELAQVETNKEAWAHARARRRSRTRRRPS